MSRSIPGTKQIKGREFIYIESAVDETLHQLVNSASTVRTDLVVPSAGGVIEEKVRITLKEGVSLMGVSYKGDIEGWRSRLLGICVATGRKYGFVKDSRLALSDGSTPLLEDLEIDFET